MEGVNPTRIYCKNFCNCHNVTLIQQQYDLNKGKQHQKNRGCKRQFLQKLIGHIFLTL
jgi:hypothetical protein